jgi:hypothetical protein
MAVFLSASDENARRTRQGHFFLGGWVASEEDWSRFFTPAWQERVLDGPPPIPYLHMTEMRSQRWRSEYGLSKLQADDRIDEALAVIDTMPSLYPIGIYIDGGYFREELKETKIVVSSGGAKIFEPDYICFLGYAYTLLRYLEAVHPEAERIDFLVERNGDVTKHIQEFHSHFAHDLEAIGKGSLVKLVGELIPSGKERAPLQAADVLCWHTGRAREPETMDASDVRRYKLLAHRKGTRLPFSNSNIVRLKSELLERAPNNLIRWGP